MTRIPNTNASSALAIYDGTIRVGTVVPHDGSYFAFDAVNDLIGEYQTQHQAVRTIPSAAKQTRRTTRKSSTEPR